MALESKRLATSVAVAPTTFTFASPPIVAVPPAAAAASTVTEPNAPSTQSKKLANRESKRRDQFKAIQMPNNQTRKLNEQRVRQRNDMLIKKRVKGAVAAVAAAAAAANKSPMHDPNGICTIYPTATLIVANGLQRLAIQSFSQVPQLRPLEREFPILVWKKLQVVIQQILHTKQTVSATELEFLGDAIEIIVDHLIEKDKTSMVLLMQAPYNALDVVHNLWILLAFIASKRGSIATANVTGKSSTLATASTVTSVTRSGQLQTLRVPNIKSEGLGHNDTVKELELKFQAETILLTQAFLRKEDGHTWVPRLAQRWVAHVPALVHLFPKTVDAEDPIVLMTFQLLRTWFEALPGIVISLPDKQVQQQQQQQQQQMSQQQPTGNPRQVLQQVQQQPRMLQDKEQEPDDASYNDFEILQHMPAAHWKALTKQVLMYLTHLVQIRFPAAEQKKNSEVRMFWDPEISPLARTNKAADGHLEALLDALLGCLIRLCSTNNSSCYMELLKSNDLLPAVIALCQYESILVQESATALLLVFCKDEPVYTKAFFQRIADPLGQYLRDFYLSWHYNLTMHEKTLERTEHMYQWQLVRRNVASLVFNWFVIHPPVISHFLPLIPSWHTIVRDVTHCETQMEVLRMLKVATEESPEFAKTAFMHPLFLATLQSALSNPHHAGLTLEALEYFNGYLQFWKKHGETKYNQVLKHVLNVHTGLLYCAITYIVDIPYLPSDIETIAEALVAELDDASDKEEQGIL